MKNSLRRLLILLVVLSVSGLGVAKEHSTYILYVGTYTTNGSKGIYAYRYDEASGALQSLGLAAATENPSFLVADREGAHIFAVNETENYQGQSSGGVSAFAVDQKTWKLEQLNEVASHGADPAYISLDRSEKYVLVANYTGGNVAVFPILQGGKLGEASSILKDEGQLGPNRKRQESAHAHWIEATAHNHFVYVADLGLDRVLIYKFDDAKGTLTRGGQGKSDYFSATLAPGTGPRHVAFSADGKFMYVIGELDSTVTVFANQANDTYRSIQKISALPAGFSGTNTAAEIAIHPSGRFLYTSNRGDNSIAEFSVDQASGKLTQLGFVSTEGKTPRNFAIDPAGTRLMVANQDSGNIVEYRIANTTGKLSPTGQELKVPSPVCLIFVAER